MKHLMATLLWMTALSAAAAEQRFTGTITDDVCGTAGHAEMRMAPTDAECTVLCVEGHGARLVLLSDSKDVYTLSDRRKVEKFAAQRVRVIGTLDAKTKTIQVNSIAAVKAK